jgi:hypothetical protein
MPNIESIYAVLENDYILIESNTYNYADDNNIIELLKKYKKLQTGNNFNKPVDFIPDSVTHINFGTNFDQELNNLPSSLKYLEFSNFNIVNYNKFNQKLDNLPYGLETLKFVLNNRFNQLLVNLPPTLIRLDIYCTFLKNIDTIINSLPDSIEYLKIHFTNYNEKYTESIKNVIKLPKNIKTFTNGHDINIFIENYNYTKWKTFFTGLQQN